MGLLDFLRGKKEKTEPSPPVVIQADSLERYQPSDGTEGKILGATLTYLDAEALHFWHGKTTDYKIPDYYSGSAFGRNAGPALRRLLKDGYLRFADIEKSIYLKTVPELKAILAEHGLKTSGKKAELVYRLTNNLSQQELEILFPTSVYESTEKGDQELDAYSVVFASEALGFGIPYYRLLKEKKATPAAEDTDIILRILQQDLDNAQKSGNMANREAYRVRASEIGRFLKGLGRTDEAIEYFCLSFFLFWHRNTFELKANSIIAYGYDAKRIDECGKLCGYSFNRTLEIFQSTLRKHNPFDLCTSQNIRKAVDVFRQSLAM